MPRHQLEITNPVARIVLPLLVLLLVVAGAPPAGAQTAFRFSSLVLRDPHTFVLLDFLGCRDITDEVPLGLGSSFNEILFNSITMDEDLDGYLDLNGLIYLVPSNTVVGTATTQGGTVWNPEDEDGELIFHFGACTPPFEAPLCEPDIVQPIHRLAYASDPTVVCLDAIPGTLNAAYLAPQEPATPCFVTQPFEMMLHVGAVLVPLSDVQIGATYVDGTPPRLVDGLIRGFLSEPAADNVLFPDGMAIVGGQPLSSVLPGGATCCATDDDRDTLLGEAGWWVYLNFEAEEVPFTAVTGVPEGPGAGTGGLLLTAAPNPFRDRVVFSLHGGGAAAPKLDVLDVTGRLIRSVGGGRWSFSSREIAWDGTDARGLPVPSGVYFVRYEDDGERIVRKIVRTR